MSKHEHIDQLFEELQGKFDTEMPAKGHQERFMAKLQARQATDKPQVKKTKWVTYLAIAASLALLISVSIQIFEFPQTEQPDQDTEMQKTEYYFASVLHQEMEKLQAEASPETQRLIDDTMLQITRLESDYEKLESALQQGGDRSVILHAMITNFQTRISLLQDVLKEIEQIKKLKNSQNENFTI